MRARGLILGVVLLVVGAAGAIVFHRQMAAPAAADLLGMVRQTEIRIAPEIGGRLAALPLGPGAAVRRGDVVAVTYNPGLGAALEEARAALGVSRAERARVHPGVRAEEVAIAREAVASAQATADLATESNARLAALAGKDFASRQQLDESNAELAKADAAVALKRAQFDEAGAGPTVEERAVADASVAFAEARLARLQARFAKTTLTSPVDGVVSLAVAERGEIMVPGRPVLVIAAADGLWFGFTLREDALAGIDIGTTLALETGDGRAMGRA